MSARDAALRIADDPSVEWAEPNGYYAVSACERAPLDPMLVELAALWHTFDLDRVEHKTDEILDFVKHKREEIRARSTD